MGGVTLTRKEQTRIQVLNSVTADQVPLSRAAEVLGVSESHVWRILAACREEGAAALAHGNRGRRPANATTEAQWLGSGAAGPHPLRGANHTHLTELRQEEHGITFSRSTVRRVLLAAGMASPKKLRPPRHWVRRQRMPQEGMLIQVDGSHHAWPGGAWTPLRPAAGRGRRYRHRALRPLLPRRGYQVLLPASGGPAPEQRNNPHPLQRPSRGL